MEKYKTIILIEKMKKCLEEGNRKEALTIAESIDKKKLKNMADLSIVAESYFQNGNYEEAKSLYQRIYQKTRSRRIVAQLVHLSIKLSEIDEANKYLAEFVQIAPHDFYQHIFRYSIDKIMKAPLAKLIEDLVALKNMEYIESWAYELAKLYHKAGLKEPCVAECDDIILWFGSGEYVERAKALRAYYRGDLKIEDEDHNDLSKTLSEEKADKEDQKNRIHSYEDGEEIQNNDTNTIQEEAEDLEVNEIEEVTVASEENQEIESTEYYGAKELANMLSEQMNENKVFDSSTDNVQNMVNQTEAVSETGEIDEDEFGNLESALAEQVLFTFREDELNSEAVMKENKISREEYGAAEIREVEEVELEEAMIEDVEIKEAVIEDVEIEEAVIETVAEIEPIAKEESTAKKSSLSTDIDDEVPMKDQELVVDGDSVEYKYQVEKKLDVKGKIAHKKINLKVLTNEQLVGEEQDELVLELNQCQVSLLDVFGNFMRMEPVRKQLVRSMDQILTQKSKNIIITGETQSGKTHLAKDLAKWLFRMKLIQSNRVALVDAEKLNSKSLMSKKDQLKDCVVIIEHSSMMSKETVKSLLELSAWHQNSIAIILEDTREKINRLLRGNTQLNSIFNNRVHLNKYTLEDYMGFAYDYITEQDYEIEMDAFIALQNEFTLLMHKKRENSLKAILSYLDSVMLKAEKRSSEQLKVLAQTGHFADTELMVLKKEDLKS